VSDPYQNPPLPPGLVVWTKPVTPEMRRWAIEVDHDPVSYPLFTLTSRDFDGVETVWARVEWHTKTWRNGHEITGHFRGVTLYEHDSAQPAPTPSPPAVIEGIDVSAYQGAIDWSAVAAGGKRFAIVRASDGLYHPDMQFAANWAGSVHAGLDVGAYQFFRPTQDPVEQAKLLLSMMPTDAPPIDPTLDVETLDGANPNEVAARIGAWLDYVSAELPYSQPFIYTSPGFWQQLPSNDLPSKARLWVAHWGVTRPTLPHGWSDWVYWQYSARGQVPGIHGPVDLDRFKPG
jgi:GH25 family lysozyme M1 (1,4-beta-N-acetylmuramidase)